MIDLEALAYDDQWLDEGVAAHYPPLAQDWARVGKIAEEHGEAIAELIAWTGQNPRKGAPDTSARDRLLVELADVALTAILAIQHFTKDTAQTCRVVTDRAARLHSRILDLEAKEQG
jgi:hypothetical protein